MLTQGSFQSISRMLTQISTLTTVLDSWARIRPGENTLKRASYDVRGFSQGRPRGVRIDPPFDLGHLP
jgi:hypothetical protein